MSERRNRYSRGSVRTGRRCIANDFVAYITSSSRRNSSKDCDFDVLVLSALNKSAARKLETSILRILKNSGYIIENSGNDAKHIHFGVYSSS